MNNIKQPILALGDWYLHKCTKMYCKLLTVVNIVHGSLYPSHAGADIDPEDLTLVENETRRARYELAAADPQTFQ